MKLVVEPASESHMFWSPVCTPLTELSPADVPVTLALTLVSIALPMAEGPSFSI